MIAIFTPVFPDYVFLTQKLKLVMDYLNINLLFAKLHYVDR